MITVLANEAIITILEHFRNSSGGKELEPELSIALHTLEEKIKNEKGLSWKQLGTIAAVEQYIEKTGGRSPRICDLSSDKNLPSPTVFKTIFGKTVHQWCLENYPEYTYESPNQFQYGGKRYSNIDEIKSAFISEYYRLKPKTQDEFDARKDKTIPYWVTMAENLGVSSWLKLLELLKLPRYGEKEKVKLRVDVHFRKPDKVHEEVSEAQSGKRTNWTDELIRARISEFISQHGRIPKQKELLSNAELPAPAIITRIEKKNYRVWLHETYPDVASKSWKLDLLENEQIEKQEWLTLFRKEYMRIKPTCGMEYDKKRSEGTPTWGTIAKLIGEDRNKWDNLKKIAGVADVPISEKDSSGDLPK